MADQVEVVNKALIFIGESPVDSIDSDEKGVQLSRVIWNSTRDAVLRAGLWHFARKQATLALADEKPIVDWTHILELPDDYIRMVRTEEDVKYEIYGNRVYSHDQVFRCVYISRVEEVGKWDPLFVDAMAMKLAYQLALPITDNRALMADAEALYMKYVSRARTVDSQDSTPKDLHPDLWDIVRISSYAPD